MAAFKLFLISENTLLWKKKKKNTWDMSESVFVFFIALNIFSTNKTRVQLS